MKIISNGSQTAGKAPSASFSGNVRRDWLFAAPEPAHLSTSCVSFEPGGRTAWHTHPLGQALFIVAGCGWVQIWGQDKQEVRAGDVVWFEPGEKHWHGGTATTAMTHISCAESLDGEAVVWMEHVTEEQFNG
jgi:quercetin dioxygenase-like cupin family protein